MIGCSCNIPDFLIFPNGDNVLDNGINKPIDLAVFAPWVRILVNGNPDNLANSQIITVGNQSQGNLPADAVIKSFQYGVSDGFTTTFEIVDIEGGNFCNFINKFVKNLNDPAVKNIVDDNLIFFQFGINGSVCGTESSTPYGNITSSWHKAFITQIVPTYENGMFKFVVSCVDLSDIYHQQIIAVNDIGEQYLVNAIGSLFDMAVPSISTNDIFFVLRDGTGNPIAQSIDDLAGGNCTPVFDADGNDEQCLGPKARWSFKSRNPLSILQDWLGVVQSINKKGFVIGFQDNQIFIKEDDKPGCDKQPPQPVFGTRRAYIVNGGQFSKVISFTPHIKWLFFQSLQGGGVQPLNEQQDINQDAQSDCAGDADTGSTSIGGLTLLPPEHPVDEKRGDNAIPKRMQADKAQFLAENVFAPITAQLRIQGDPTYESIVDNIGQFITIVVVNPFVPNTSPNSCDWTIQTVDGNESACNAILSNSNWMIKGFFHDMKEGSFTTTLDLILATPGVDLPPGAGLGG